MAETQRQTAIQARRGPVKTFVIAVAILIAAALASEALLHAVLGLGNKLLFAYDPACGYVSRPNQHLRRFFVRTDINSYGMRSAEVSAYKRPGTVRIMFLGDSIVYGTTQVDQGSIFATLIGRELPARIGKPVDELNASAGGWAIENEYGFLKSRGTLGSDYVFLVVNSADMTQRRSTLREVGGEASTRNEFALGELLERLPPLWRQYAHTDDPGASVRVDPGAEEINKANLTRIADFAARAGSRLIVLFIPFRSVIASQSEHSANPSLVEWAKASSVQLIDFTGAVSSYPPDSVTLSDHIHYNVRGNRILASAIEDRIAPLLSR